MENEKKIELYDPPSAMEPLYPNDPTKSLEKLAIELIKKSSMLSGAMNPTTRRAIADFLRPMNSYYSNLIEGHDTHPIDIDKALRSDYSHDKKKRNLQKEALAHIEVHKDINAKIVNNNSHTNPFSIEFLKDIHKEFYNHLPSDFKKVISKEGKINIIIPGELRNTEVEVGKHIAPDCKYLESFTTRFEEFYTPKATDPLTKKIIMIAAAHHRFTWIHPFLDGNGRVVRLFSDACFMLEELDSSGLWSMSRGLAKTKDKYRSYLANADLKRQGNHDGRGNLSNNKLLEFCSYFIKVAIDQVNFIYDSIDTETMTGRLESFSDLMVLNKKMKPEAKYLLVDLFLKGKLSFSEAMRITRTSDKTLKAITDSLQEMNLLSAKKEGVTRMLYAKYPISFSPVLFPGLYPAEKEIDIMQKINN